MQSITSHRVATSALLTLICAAASAQFRPPNNDGPLTVQAGMGLAIAPDYLGGIRRRVQPAPFLNMSYRTEHLGSIEFGGRGLAWAPLQTPLYGVGVMLGFSEGRGESTQGLGKHEPIPRLLGMGKIKAAAELGVFGNFTLAGASINAMLLKGAARGHGGVHGDLGAALPFQLGGLQWALSPGVRFGNATYNRAYFGVNAVQSLNSGLKIYAPRAGVYAVGLSLGSQYEINKHWALQSMLGAERLVGDAAKSPIVQRRIQPMASMQVVYTF
jgi:MipA family protein